MSKERLNKKAGILLSYECLFVLAFMHKRKQVNASYVCSVLGLIPRELEKLLSEMEALDTIQKIGDSYKIKRRGRKIAKALELYKFNFAKPQRSYTTTLLDFKRKRRLAINSFYFPRKLELED